MTDLLKSLAALLFAYNATEKSGPHLMHGMELLALAESAAEGADITSELNTILAEIAALPSPQSLRSEIHALVSPHTSLFATPIDPRQEAMNAIQKDIRAQLGVSESAFRAASQADDAINLKADNFTDVPKDEEWQELSFEEPTPPTLREQVFELICTQAIGAAATKGLAPGMADCIHAVTAFINKKKSMHDTCLVLDKNAHIVRTCIQIMARTEALPKAIAASDLPESAQKGVMEAITELDTAVSANASIGTALFAATLFVSS